MKNDIFKPVKSYILKSVLTHNDLLGGILVCKKQELAERYFEYYITTGDTLDSFDSWLLLRSLKTLDVRVRQHTKNAQAVVKYLKQDPRVEKVLYPGKGGMISFYLKAEDDVARLLDLSLIHI